MVLKHNIHLIYVPRLLIYQYDLTLLALTPYTPLPLYTPFPLYTTPLLLSSHLGAVYQSNVLWEHLSVEDHLSVFARIRGVPEHRLLTVSRVYV